MIAYVALVIDAYPRHIVGWRVGHSLHTGLVPDAFEQVLHARERHRELVLHSDRGSQYPSLRYTERLADAGIAASVGSKGDCYDNALAEAITELYKTEVIHHLGPWASASSTATPEWVHWLNHRRLLEPTGYLPAVACELAYRQRQGQATA